MSCQKINVGDSQKAICEKCCSLETATFKLRDVPLSDGSGLVNDLLVGVCNKCDCVIILPHQTTPTIKNHLEISSDEISTIKSGKSWRNPTSAIEESSAQIRGAINGPKRPSDEFIHNGNGVAGFYRNAESARAEAIVIQNNAANGPKRPTCPAIKYKLDQETNGMFELQHVVGVFYD